MIHTPAFQMATESPWLDLGNGIQRQMLGYDDKIMLVKVKFEAGAVGAMHEHHHSQVTYVESGSFDMTIGDEVKRIATGDAYYVLPHVVHGITCIEPGVLLDVFSPMREDFLK